MLGVGPSARAEDASYAEDLAIGLALSSIIRLDTPALRKLCKHARDTFAFRGDAGSFAPKGDSAGSQALQILCRAFDAKDSPREALVDVLESIIDEALHSKQTKRRNSFLNLMSMILGRGLTHFSSCLWELLRRAEKAKQFCCVVVLSQALVALSKRNLSDRSNQAALQELLGSWPILLRAMNADVDCEGPNQFTSLVSDSALTLLLCEAECIIRSSSEGRVVNAESESGARHDAAAWLWTNNGALLDFIRTHRRWNQHMLAGAPGGTLTSSLICETFSAIERRLRKLSLDDIKDHDRDKALQVYVDCVTKWFPALRFEESMGSDWMQGCGPPPSYAQGIRELKVTVGALVHDKRDDEGRSLLLRETFFQGLVAVALAAAFKAPAVGTKEHTQSLHQLIEALSPVIRVGGMGALVYNLTGAFLCFALGGWLKGARNSAQNTTLVRDVVFSIFDASAEGEEGSRVAGIFFDAMIAEPDLCEVITRALVGLCGSEHASDEGIHRLLGGIAALSRCHQRGVEGCPSADDAIWDRVCRTIAGLGGSDLGCHEDSFTDAMCALPAHHLIPSLFDELGKMEQRDWSITCDRLLCVLERGGPAAMQAVHDRLCHMMQSPHACEKERVEGVAKRWGKDARANKLWPSFIESLIKASAAEPSNEVLVRTLSTLAAQLSHHDRIVTAYVSACIGASDDVSDDVAWGGVDGDGVSDDVASESEPHTPRDIYTLLHPLLILRILSVEAFQTVAARALAPPSSSEGLRGRGRGRGRGREEPWEGERATVFDWLAARMVCRKTPTEVRRLASELVGKMDPTVSMPRLLASLGESVRSLPFDLGACRACLYATCCAFRMHGKNI